MESGVIGGTMRRSSSARHDGGTTLGATRRDPAGREPGTAEKRVVVGQRFDFGLEPVDESGHHVVGVDAQVGPSGVGHLAVYGHLEPSQAHLRDPEAQAGRLQCQDLVVGAHHACFNERVNAEHVGALLVGGQAEHEIPARGPAIPRAPGRRLEGR